MKARVSLYRTCLAALSGAAIAAVAAAAVAPRAARAEGVEQVAAYSFYASPDERIARRTELNRGWQGFAAVSVEQVDARKKAWWESCQEAFIQVRERLPFDIMVDRGAVTPEQRREYAQGSRELKPEQIAFLELRTWYADLGEAMRDPDFDLFRLAETQTDDERYGWAIHGEKWRNPGYRVRKATLRSVNGQYWDPRERRVVQASLPWQTEPKYRDDPRYHVDRERHPFIVEWGRVAQVSADQVIRMSGLAVLSTYLEARLLGYAPEQVTIFGHALDRAHAAVYRGKYGFKHWVEPEKDQTEFILHTTLAELMERYPPSESIAHLAELERATGGRLGERELIDLLVDSKTLLREDLDWVVAGHDLAPDGPIVIRDKSMAPHAALRLRLERLGIGDAFEAVRGALSRLQPAAFDGWDRPSYLNAVEIRPKEDTAARADAVFVSNLDPKRALEDPGYLPGLLLAVNERHRRKLEGTPASWERAFGAASPVAIVTSDPELGELLTRAASYTDATEGVGTVHYFTQEWLRELERAAPEIAFLAKGSLKPGHWQTRYSWMNLFSF